MPDKVRSHFEQLGPGCNGPRAGANRIGRRSGDSGGNPQIPGTSLQAGRGLCAGEASCLSNAGTRRPPPPRATLLLPLHHAWGHGLMTTRPRSKESQTHTPGPTLELPLDNLAFDITPPQGASFPVHCIHDICFLQSSTSFSHMYCTYLEPSAPRAHTTQVGCKPLPLSCSFLPYFSPCTYKLLSHRVTYGFSFSGTSKACLVCPWVI